LIENLRKLAMHKAILGAVLVVLAMGRTFSNGSGKYQSMVETKAELYQINQIIKKDLANNYQKVQLLAKDLSYTDRLLIYQFHKKDPLGFFSLILFYHAESVLI
jgi:hypothetical protein